MSNSITMGLRCCQIQSLVGSRNILPDPSTLSLIWFIKPKAIGYNMIVVVILIIFIFIVVVDVIIIEVNLGRTCLSNLNNMSLTCCQTQLNLS